MANTMNYCPEDETLLGDDYRCPECGFVLDEEYRLAEPPPGLYELWKAERDSVAGMEPNPNGHAYGCGCVECMDYYRSLK